MSTDYDWPEDEAEWGVCAVCGYLSGIVIRRPVKKCGSKWLCRLCAESAGYVEEETDGQDG